MLEKNYTEKCDVWSLGVVLYILLTGLPPFNGETDTDIMEKVSKGVYSLEIPEFSSVSKSAKDLISKMLTFDQTERISAKQALGHPWFEESKGEGVPLNSSLGNLSAFMFSGRFQQLVSFYIANNLTTSEERGKIMDIFRELDADKDGKLSRDELIKGCEKFKGLSTAEVDDLLAKYDQDGNGFIDYSGTLLPHLKNSSQQPWTKRRS